VRGSLNNQEAAAPTTTSNTLRPLHRSTKLLERPHRAAATRHTRRCLDTNQGMHSSTPTTHTAHRRGTSYNGQTPRTFDSGASRPRRIMVCLCESTPTSGVAPAGHTQYSYVQLRSCGSHTQLPPRLCGGHDLSEGLQLAIHTAATLAAHKKTRL